MVLAVDFYSEQNTWTLLEYSRRDIIMSTNESREGQFFGAKIPRTPALMIFQDADLISPLGVSYVRKAQRSVAPKDVSTCSYLLHFRGIPHQE